MSKPGYHNLKLEPNWASLVQIAGRLGITEDQLRGERGAVPEVVSFSLKFTLAVLEAFKDSDLLKIAIEKARQSK